MDETKAGKFLTFKIANEDYGISLLKVREIIGMMPITSVPRTPAFVKGVINLRGKVIPVTDLRRRFDMPEADYTDRTCIIVVEVQGDNSVKCWESKQCGKQDCPAYNHPDHRCWMISGTFCRNEIQGSYHEKMEACRKCDVYQGAMVNKTVCTIGIVVDEVSEVLNIRGEDIQEAPNFGAKVATECIHGMANMEAHVKILLNIDRVLTAEEITELGKAA
jgi:chemotaxis signal transduction protein